MCFRGRWISDLSVFVENEQVQGQRLYGGVSITEYVMVYEQHIIESKLQQHVGEDQNSDLFLTKMKNNPAADICRIWVFAKICVESGFQRHLVGTWKFIAEFDILIAGVI